MPLIRYRTGNCTCFSINPCHCCSNLPRFEKLEGRMINNVQIGNNQTINIHQLNELLYANPAVRGFNAFLSQVDKKQVLHLTIDAFDHFDLLPISSRLPKYLPVAFSYGNADPFNFRMKSQIQFR